jgi:hypothetical protein
MIEGINIGMDQGKERICEVKDSLFENMQSVVWL